MWHRDKSVNRTEARKFFQITSKEVEAGPPYLGRKMSVFVCVRKLIESANTHASETAYAVVWVRCFHILPSDRSLNKLLGLPVSMFHVPLLRESCHLSPAPFTHLYPLPLCTVKNTIPIIIDFIRFVL